MIELGGNITLDGFTGRDYAELIVVKKIVGRYARQMSDNHRDFDGLTVALQSATPGKYAMSASCVMKGKEFSSEASAQNLFIALDAALKSLSKNL